MIHRCNTGGSCPLLNAPSPARARPFHHTAVSLHGGLHIFHPARVNVPFDLYPARGYYVMAPRRSCQHRDFVTQSKMLVAFSRVLQTCTFFELWCA
ncbi:hypothetical protein NDU88_006035 [Pleurodeles waltl]|uniref:Uncharacterized protein n=1 Tax=Pleurodeles waltl TaxID=8319 RepID=A0AAV7MDU1_PLEWA|nr:hypothetical protein NDU88_006035 [Pleurodeles waltl]